MDNGYKQFADGSYQVVVRANHEPPAGGRLADEIVRYLGAERRARGGEAAGARGSAGVKGRPMGRWAR